MMCMGWKKSTCNAPAGYGGCKPQPLFWGALIAAIALAMGNRKGGGAQ